MSLTVLDRYCGSIASGQIARDRAQEAIVRKLDRLREKLEAERLAHKGSALGWLFGGRPRDAAIRGLYVWGSVGRGKTMLMDLFFDAVAIERKRRVHFHAFLADVHARVHAWRIDKKAGRGRGDDPIEPVAAALAEDARLLCFDEFSVTDIADAMILGRLFTALFGHGVTIVATSNVDPQDLYKDGLNRALFLPFIALLQERMEVVKLDARTDFRLEKLSGEPVYHVPANESARRALDRAFKSLTGREHGAPATLDVLGRKLAVPEAAGGVARFSFADLCERPLGSADFLAIARRFHSVIVDGIPVIGPDRRDTAKRFINAIDTFYDRHVKLLASAAAEPAGLYAATDGKEAFEFARTVSRLVEMRSADYLGMAHGKPDSSGIRSTAGIVDT